jgi:hypothetical protein
LLQELDNVFDERYLKLAFSTYIIFSELRVHELAVSTQGRLKIMMMIMLIRLIFLLEPVNSMKRRTGFILYILCLEQKIELAYIRAWVM